MEDIVFSAMERNEHAKVLGNEAYASLAFEVLHGKEGDDNE